MERNLKEQKKIMGSRTNEIISDCLSNPVILKKVMENFSNTGLLTLSLVNKLWNYESKSLMRDRGNLSPSFKPYYLSPSVKFIQRPMCQELGAFASDLRRMTVVPFSGMKIQQRDDYSHKCRNPSRTEALEQSLHVILDRLPWKQISIDLDRCFEYHPKCPTTLLAKRVMRDFSEVVEELSVGPSTPPELFIQEFVQDFSFPRLRILKFGDEFASTADKWHIQLFKAIVSRAPNFQELRSNMDTKYVAEVLEGSSAVLVPTMFYPFSPDAKLSEGSVKFLKLERMALVSFNGDFSPQRFNTIIPALLQTYRSTLNHLRIHMAYIGPLMSCGISLPNVKKFQIDMSENLEPSHPVVMLLKAFDFTHLLPALTTVDIKSKYGGHERIPAQAFEPALKEPMPDRAANIKHLYLTDDFGYKSAPILSEILPNIQKLSVKQTHSWRNIPIGLIWELWADLKELEVSIRRQGVSAPFMWTNYDSVLCGIFPEEVAELRGKDDEYLKTVNIVPVMPSITCFKDLRTLKLLHEQNFVCKQKKDPTAFCSKIAGLIALAKCPNLAVTIQTNLPELEEVLGHMKPYATVVLERRKWNYLE